MADEDVLNTEELEEDADPETAELDEEGKQKALEAELKEAVEVEVEDAGTLRKKLKVTLPADKIAKRVDEQYGELRKDAQVPGFRKGRAPRRLLEKRFGQDLNETLVQQLVSASYMAAIDKKELKVLGDPQVWVQEEGKEGETLMEAAKALPLMKLPAEGALTFTCEVELRPEFELPELEGIPVKQPDIKVEDKDLDEQIERLRTGYGHYDPQPEGEVQADDRLTTDLTLTCGEEVLREEQSIPVNARAQVVDGIVFDKLGEALAGAKVGEERTSTATIPDDNPKEQLRGKTAEVKIKVREIQRLHRMEVPELIKTMGFDDEQGLRSYLRERLEFEVGSITRRHLRGQIIEHLVNNTTMELPSGVSERQAGRLVVRRMLEMMREGVPESDVEKQLDQMRTSARESAVRDLKVFFIMEKLAEKYEVEVSEGELNNEIAQIAAQQGQRFDRVRDELAKKDGMTHLYLTIRDDKIVDRLLGQAKVEGQPPAEKAGEGGSVADAT